jgi:glutaredoxin
MPAQTSTTDAIAVYWQPGCSSCLRAKEFLTRAGVPFRSRNVLADEGAFEELARFGLKRVPIVTRGDQWVDGQVLQDVARIAGIDLGGPRALPVPELRRRQIMILDGAQRFLAQLPDHALGLTLPNRPRSYSDLGYHIFSIADAFLEHEAGIPLAFDAYNRVAKEGERSKDALAAYGRGVQDDLARWFDGPGRNRDWQAKAQVYYGDQTVHEFFERTVWHSGQHTRQLMWVLEEKLGITVDRPLGPEMWVGLPMPESVWDS